MNNGKEKVCENFLSVCCLFNLKPRAFFGAYLSFTKFFEEKL